MLGGRQVLRKYPSKYSERLLEGGKGVRVRETVCGGRHGSELIFDEILDVLRAVVGAVGSCGIAVRSSGDVRKSVNQECGFFQDGWGAAGEKDEL